MKKSVNLYFINGLDTKDKLDEIKKCGFDEFFTGIDDTNETLTLNEQVEYAKKIGLGLTMVHCFYDESILDSFWLEGEEGEQICNSYIKQIEQCGKLTNNFVVHLNSSCESKTSTIGLQRIKKMLKVCQKFNTNLCIENLYTDQEIPYIFQNIKHKNLKICFDYGHHNFLTPKFDIITA